MVPVEILQTASGGNGDGTLYVRFTDDGVYLRLEVGESIYETQHPLKSTYWNAMTEDLLPQLPGVVVIQRHAVRFQPSDTNWITIKQVIESVWFDQAKEKVLCKFEVTEAGMQHHAEGDGEDIEYVLKKVADAIPGRMEMCFFCTYAHFMSAGGEDLRHGWNCFRDLNVDPSTFERWWDHKEAYALAVQNVDAFHWCPAFKRRVRPIL